MAKGNSKKDFKKSDEQLENVNEALGSAGQWVESHQKLLYGIVIAIFVIVLGFVLVKKYIIEPKKQDCSNASASVQKNFENGDYVGALNGDSVEASIGFAAIADEYSSFQEGELASLYAGICLYKQGKYEEAISYIEKFSARKEYVIDPAAKQLIGDAYVQLGKLEDAVKAFMEAADSESQLIAPMSLKKAGLVYMELGNKEEAKKCFEQVKEKYLRSNEAQDIDKFIQLAQ